eukprot:401370_1
MVEQIITLIFLISLKHIQSQEVPTIKRHISCGDTISDYIVENKSHYYVFDNIDDQYDVNFDGCLSPMDMKIVIYKFENNTLYDISDAYCSGGDSCGSCLNNSSKDAENFTIPNMTHGAYPMSIQRFAYNVNPRYYQFKINCIDVSKNRSHVQSQEVPTIKRQYAISCGDTIRDYIPENESHYYVFDNTDDYYDVNFDGCSSPMDMKIIIYKFENNTLYDISDAYCSGGDSCGSCLNNSSKYAANFTIWNLTYGAYPMSIRRFAYNANPRYYQFKINCIDVSKNRSHVQSQEVPTIKRHISCGDTIRDYIPENESHYYVFDNTDDYYDVNFDGCSSPMDMKIIIYKFENNTLYDISDAYCSGGDSCGSCLNNSNKYAGNFTIPNMTHGAYPMSIRRFAYNTNEHYYQLKINCRLARFDVSKDRSEILSISFLGKYFVGVLIYIVVCKLIQKLMIYFSNERPERIPFHMVAGMMCVVIDSRVVVIILVISFFFICYLFKWILIPLGKKIVDKCYNCWIRDKRVADKCVNMNINNNCIHMEHFRNTMNLYDPYVVKKQLDNKMFDELKILPILDSFLHLKDEHDSEEQFEWIYNSLTNCDINKCDSFRRNFRDRSEQSEKNDHKLGSHQTIKLEIVDKIHCYYYHSYNIGHRLRAQETINVHKDPNKVKQVNESWIEYMTNNNITELRHLLHKKRKSLGSVDELLSKRINKYNNLSQKIQQTQSHVIIDVEDEKSKLYHYGYMFHYGKACCDFRNVRNKMLRRKIITISPKYANLKEEVTKNSFCILTIEQYTNALIIAKLYRNTQYCKSKFKSTIKIEHILSLMLHCNYTDLQYHFNKTYRENEGRDHQEFYFWGKYLTEAVKQHGTKMCDGNIHRLYHGIGEQLSVNVFVPDMNGLAIGCPLSTTSSYSVAVNFTNYNNGLIVEFSDGSNRDHRTSPRYFSVSWLSDFANESEYLLIQNEPSSDSLIIHNIINAQYGIECHHLIYALYMRSSWRLNVAPHVGAKWREQFYDKTWESIIGILKDEIWKFELEGSDFITDKYAKKLISAYLKNEKGTRLKCNKCCHRIDYWCKQYVSDKWNYGKCWLNSTCILTRILICITIGLPLFTEFKDILFGEAELTVENISNDLRNLGDFWLRRWDSDRTKKQREQDFELTEFINPN